MLNREAIAQGLDEKPTQFLRSHVGRRMGVGGGPPDLRWLDARRPCQFLTESLVERRADRADIRGYEEERRGAIVHRDNAVVYPVMHPVRLARSVALKPLRRIGRNIHLDASRPKSAGLSRIGAGGDSRQGQAGYRSDHKAGQHSEPAHLFEFSAVHFWLQDVVVWGLTEVQAVPRGSAPATQPTPQPLDP